MYIKIDLIRKGVAKNIYELFKFIQEIFQFDNRFMDGKEIMHEDFVNFG